MDQATLWEILVPSHTNDGLEYKLEHHQTWDNYVRSISGGLTILKPAKGQWLNPQGELFSEKMIPVRIYCTEQEIDKVIVFTLQHYDQQAVLAYQISAYVKLVHRSA